MRLLMSVCLLLFSASMLRGEDKPKIKVVAFDLFGTVYDLSAVDREEIRDYVRQVKSNTDWNPLNLPAKWANIPAFPDSKDGIEKLKTKYTVVTMSNAPLGLQGQLNASNNISWHMTIPLELRAVYKPNLKAYTMILDLLGVAPREVVMVTANKTFGDLEAARSLGMHAVLIRVQEGPQTISELFDYLNDLNVDIEKGTTE